MFFGGHVWMYIRNIVFFTRIGNQLEEFKPSKQTRFGNLPKLNNKKVVC